MSKDERDGSEGPSAQVYQLYDLNSPPDSLQKFARAALPDTDAGAVGSNALEREDEYHDLYASTGGTDRGILEPPYPLRLLDRLCQENNALLPCVEAMVTNVDGTGYEFKRRDGSPESDEDKAKIRQLDEFFDQIWPGTSFREVRKLLRRDYERTGNAYLEVLRNPRDEIVFMRYLDAKMMRLVKLDVAVPVQKTITRNGKEVSIRVMQRERRFVQRVNGIDLIYFREFGASRDLDKTTGQWAQNNQRLPAKVRATEIIHLTCLPDSHTPYGVPRWINQLPSILGSRKAEEFNLEFFDHGGVPPALIILQGGTLQDTTRKALEQKLSGGAKKMSRVQVLEVEPSGGSLDKPTTARVTVERFGGDRTNDSMFEQYDERCEVRVRRSFRLPPLFVGQAEDVAFATAYVSYTVAEAQVFRPERDEFDSVMTIRVLPALGFPDYALVSNPVAIDDLNLKLQGITLFKDSGLVSDEDLIHELNRATGLKFRLVPEEDRPQGEPQMTVDDAGQIQPKTPRQQEMNLTARDAAPQRQPQASQSKKAETRGVRALAHDILASLAKRDVAALTADLRLVQSLDRKGLNAFHQACAEIQFEKADEDPEGMSHLLACTLHMLATRDDPVALEVS